MADSCWVNTGWQRIQRLYAQNRTIGNLSLKPYEFGLYQKNGQKIAVLFWHLVGGEVNRYYQKVGWRSGLTGRLERLPSFFKDWQAYGLDQRREQIFIRIACWGSLEPWWQHPDFVSFMQSLEALSIFENRHSNSPVEEAISPFGS